MELWGMQGIVLIAFAVGCVGIINYFVKKPFLPFVSKKMWALIGIVAILYAGSQTAFWGFAAAPVEEGEVVIPGVTYMVLGSESDSNLLYDGLTKTFSCTLKDNSSSGALTFATVTFTLTVYRTDTVTTGQNPPVCKVDAVSVPTFQVLDDANVYSVVDKVTTGDWNIAITPASGSALYKTAYGAVSDGSSKAFAIVVTGDYTGVTKATDGTVYTVQFNAAGTTFTLSMVIGTAVT